MNKEEKTDIAEFWYEVAQDIAEDNKDFICTTCLNVLDKIEAFMYKYINHSYGRAIEDMIEDLWEDDEE